MTHPRQAGCFAQTVFWAAEGTSYKEDVIGKLPYPAQSPFRWACRTEYRVTGLLLLKARVAFGRRRRNHFRILRRRSFWGAVIALKPVISGLPECRLGRGPTPPPILILALIAFQGDEFALFRTAVDAASSRVVSAIQRLPWIQKRCLSGRVREYAHSTRLEAASTKHITPDHGMSLDFDGFSGGDGMSLRFVERQRHGCRPKHDIRRLLACITVAISRLEELIFSPSSPPNGVRCWRSLRRLHCCAELFALR
jgi:hypothetical protein